MAKAKKKAFFETEDDTATLEVLNSAPQTPQPQPHHGVKPVYIRPEDIRACSVPVLMRNSLHKACADYARQTHISVNEVLNRALAEVLENDTVPAELEITGESKTRRVNMKITEGTNSKLIDYTYRHWISKNDTINRAAMQYIARVTK